MQLSSVRSLCSSFAGGEWRQKRQHRCSRGAASDLHSTSRVVSLRGRKQSATDSHPTDLQFSAAAAKGAFPRVFAACCERAKRGIRRTKPTHVQPQEAQSRPLGPACTAQGAGAGGTAAMGLGMHLQATPRAHCTSREPSVLRGVAQRG